MLTLIACHTLVVGAGAASKYLEDGQLPKSTYALNKLGYGLHLPNLPKADYLKLKQRCQDWNMSMVQVILAGLRALDYMPEEQLGKITEKAVEDV